MKERSTRAVTAIGAPRALEPLWRRGRGNVTSAWRVWRRKPLGLASGAVILLVVILGLFPGLFAPYNPTAFVGPRLEGLSTSHYFGTDQVGRDVYSRVVYGARIALMVGLVVTAITTIGGTIIGLASGYLGGKFDMVVQRIMDALLAVPGLVLAMTIVMALGPNTFTAMIAISIALLPSQNRVIRGAVMSLSKNDYILAAEAIGASRLRIMALHLFPNVIPIMLILASTLLGGAILVEAALSFLGLGTQPPTPAWGSMLSREGRPYLELAPWMAVAPGIAITITVLAFNLLGDVVRDILDPRLRGT